MESFRSRFAFQSVQLFLHVDMCLFRWITASGKGIQWPLSSQHLSTWLKVWSGTEAHLWHMKFCTILETPFRAQHFVILCTLAEMREFQQSPMVSWSIICSVILCAMMWLRLSQNDALKLLCSPLWSCMSQSYPRISSNLMWLKTFHQPATDSVAELSTIPSLVGGTPGWLLHLESMIVIWYRSASWRNCRISDFASEKLEVGIDFMEVAMFKLSKLCNWNWNVLDCHLFVAQDFLQGFGNGSRFTEEWICNIDVIMFQWDCCKFGQTRLLELCISSMLLCYTHGFLCHVNVALCLIWF